MNETPEVMNIRQAAKYLGISPDSLYKYVNSGRVPAFRLGNRWKFKKSVLAEWMSQTMRATQTNLSTIDIDQKLKEAFKKHS